jgi:SAM-dependent methyltransferase
MKRLRKDRRPRHGLPPDVAARVYDRIGRLQDTQAPIEHAAVDRLVAAGDLCHATAIFELGCGTGAFARRLLSEVLPQGSTYVGGDVSTRMVALARQRIAPWALRAKITQLDGSLPLPSADGSADRFVAAYVFDLLETDYAREVVNDAHRVLSNGGLLCVSSLTWGRSALSRGVSVAWNGLWRLAPSLVGGCRPICLRDLLDPGRWRVQEDSVVEAWGVPSEVLIATRSE